MVFKKMLAAFGVGGPSVDTVLDAPAARPGGFIDGQVHIQGGDREALIERVLLSLVTRVESDSFDREAGLEINRIPVAERFRVEAGETRSVPFRLPVPWETPITAVYGQRLPGMVMGVRTELEVAGGRDKGDLDPIAIEPLPIHQSILDAFAELGFRFKSADVEHGRIHGVQQQLPFFQEIEFWPPQQYAGRINEVELTFVTNPQGVEVILEFDKRSGMFQSGHDAYSRFGIAHAEATRADWPRLVDGWIREASDRHTAHYGSHYDHGSYGAHGHGHPHGRRGPGMGTAIAAGAAGVVGGIVAGEMIEEAFFDDDEGGGFFE
ncbi:MAG TPA: sporulation protein [Dactylosporangium sp.]|jgi:sporulation-control protein|nr:sporulation protein [Dactylosporangium sp.]